MDEYGYGVWDTGWYGYGGRVHVKLNSRLCEVSVVGGFIEVGKGVSKEIRWTFLRKQIEDVDHKVFL